MTPRKRFFYFIFLFPLILPLSACGEPSEGNHTPEAFKPKTLTTGIRWTRAEFSSDGNRLALLGENKKIAIIDMSTGKIAYGETEIERPVYFDFSPDVSELWIIDRKGNINRHDSLSTDKLINQDDKGAPVMWQLDAQKKDIEIVATAPLTYSLTKTDSSNFKMDFNGHLILNAEGKPFHQNDIIVLARTAKEVSMWHAGAKPLDTKESFSTPLARLACNNECVIVANNNTEELTTLWPIAHSKKQYFTLAGRLFLDHNNIGKLRPAMDLNGTKAVYVSGNKLGIVGLSLSGFDVSPPATEIHSLVQARLSKDGSFVITKSDVEEDQLTILNADTMKPIPLPNSMSTDQRNAIIGPNGLSLIGIGKNGEAVLVMIGSTLTGKTLAKSFADVAFRFSSTGRWLTLSTINEGMTLFDGRSGETKRVFNNHQQINFLRFSPDDKYLAIGHTNGNIEIQSTESL